MVERTKKVRFIALGTVCLVLLGGCGANQSPLEKIKIPVKVQSAVEETRESMIDYTGIVTVKDSKTYAFKSPGKIAEILVKKGQVVKPGDVLAKLDTVDLKFSLDASKAQMDAAKAQYNKAVQGPTKADLDQLKLNVEKAREVLHYTKDLYEKTQELYVAGAVSEDDLNKLKVQNENNKIQLDQAQLALTQAATRPEDIAAAKAQVSMAQSDYGYKESQIKDSVLLSDMNGYVAELIQKEGDYAGAGYPVIALRGEAQVIKTGIARQDMDKVSAGSRVVVQNDDEIYQGRITFISDIPDAATRTYEAEITLEKGELSLGSVVSVHIVIGEETGVWVPISAMLSNGRDSIFIVEEGKAVSRDIEVKSTQGMLANVTGIKKGEQIITEGMRSVHNGDEVEIQE